MRNRIISALFTACMLFGWGTSTSQALTMPSTGLKLWLKADAITNLVDGNSVSNWPDSSGKGYNAANAGALCPTFRTGVLNGKPVVRFDGIDDYLWNNTFSPGGNDVSVFVVVRTNGAYGGSYGNIFLGGKNTYTDGTGTIFSSYIRILPHSKPTLAERRWTLTRGPN